MNDTVDASSKYQDSLPISSDAIMEQLDNWGIAYTRADHVPLRTVEESKKVQGQFLSSEQGGGHIKNLYLRDNKKRNVLLVAEQDRQIDLKFEIYLPILLSNQKYVALFVIAQIEIFDMTSTLF